MRALRSETGHCTNPGIICYIRRSKFKNTYTNQIQQSAYIRSLGSIAPVTIAVKNEKFRTDKVDT